MKGKKKVAVIACTGMAGQQFVDALDNHPWFQIESLHGESSIGYKYKDKRRGFSSRQITDDILNMKIDSIENINYDNIDIIFSAVPGEVANKIEGQMAKYRPVISTSSYYRYQPDVPIFLPIVNGSHAEIFNIQKENRKWDGFVCPGPNCTTVGLTIGLYPIYKKFGINTLNVVSMQAISGAGYPGVSAYDIIGNVVPYIPNEEDKVVREVKKIFGTYNNSQIIEPDFIIDAKCNRVPVINGHMESIFLQTEEEFSISEVVSQLRNFKGEAEDLNLPNAPEFPIYVFDETEPFRPQPRIDLDNSADNGMITFIGGIEKSNFQNGIKMTVLSHNTELGAGRGGVLSAEYLVKKGFI